MMVVDTVAFRAELKKCLDKFDKDSHYIVTAVWPDSYRAFEILRDEFIQMGFEYGLLLMAESEPVLLGQGKVPPL